MANGVIERIRELIDQSGGCRHDFTFTRQALREIHRTDAEINNLLAEVESNGITCDHLLLDMPNIRQFNGTADFKDSPMTTEAMTQLAIREAETSGIKKHYLAFLKNGQIREVVITGLNMANFRVCINMLDVLTNKFMSVPVEQIHSLRSVRTNR